MPDDASTLLAAVLDDPADDTARLVLADLLRESVPTDDPAVGGTGASDCGGRGT